jgi:hypothetical protein
VFAFRAHASAAKYGVFVVSAIFSCFGQIFLNTQPVSQSIDETSKTKPEQYKRNRKH